MVRRQSEIEHGTGCAFAIAYAIYYVILNFTTKLTSIMLYLESLLISN